MKKLALVTVSLIVSAACAPEKKQNHAPVKTSIIGTWKLITGITIKDNDTIITDYTKDQEMIKIINETHFAFLRHDKNTSNDSTAVFAAGGGPYTIEDNIYTEYLEYCNYRAWENNSFSFEYSIHNDTLTTIGVEKIDKIGVNHINMEKLVRLK
ncbi:hypothetical protein SAMN04487906_2709 [Zhouia amylolytica]|uniref:Lipocalin-like domain-containing protein n=1 Tax=Zhouia amylolytica TaxID=376730 RepID=A0A1I6UXW7_9FLAO|nr:hypothetical protein [Zhouia amylolytica]SFT06213.1 hypothetical protein SAMN04487906_2709 [Zhouia amylolytica]